MKFAVVFLPMLAAAAPACLQPDAKCSERFPIGSAHVTLYRTHSLTAEAGSNARVAYIMVHGTNRNADEYFAWTLASTAAAGRLDSTVVIAPHFKARTKSGGDPVSPGELYFTNEGWKTGDKAQNGEVFSFDVMDRIITALANRTRFPNLEEIVVAGHSAGGQYVQRYAVFNSTDPKPGLKIRYVVANPSSYVYLNNLRLRSAASCSETGECTGPFVDYDGAAACAAFDEYRFGLTKLTGYAARASSAASPKRYTSRRVYYLVGELDTRTEDPNLDKSCQANAQGPNRRERGVTFWNYMRSQFKANHQFGIATGCGHSAVCVFAGTSGVKAVFGEMP